MIYSVPFFLLAIVTLSSAAGNLHPRGCVYIDGHCSEECPVGTHSYTPGCTHIYPEPTCEELYPVPDKFITCDYSSCYCDLPTVRNTALKKCVPIDECPTKNASKLELKPHRD